MVFYCQNCGIPRSKGRFCSKCGSVNDEEDIIDTTIERQPNAAKTTTRVITRQETGSQHKDREPQRCRICHQIRAGHECSNVKCDDINLCGQERFHPKCKRSKSTDLSSSTAIVPAKQTTNDIVVSTGTTVVQSTTTSLTPSSHKRKTIEEKVQQQQHEHNFEIKKAKQFIWDMSRWLQQYSSCFEGNEGQVRMYII
jgi:hypothetical protein